jgi:hypothetical protein
VAADTPLSIHIHSERAMFQVLVSPGTVGTIEAETPVPEDLKTISTCRRNNGIISP